MRLCVLAIIFFSHWALAHESRPLYIEVNEIAPEQFELQWKAPKTIQVHNMPDVSVPASCDVLQAKQKKPLNNSFLFKRVVSCAGGLKGRVIEIQYPSINPSVSSLLSINFHNGEQIRQLLGPQQNTWVVPEKMERFQVIKGYTRLGIEHIWAGIDHLLFIACLIFIARGKMKLLLTITGFTAAHSITLALAALNIFSLPVPAVEAVIALSIVFLAVEIVKNNQQSVTWRYPVVVSSSFGLLHGFGFAAVLGEIGLPYNEKIAALLFFNVGVEVGQLLFVAMLFLIYVFIAQACKQERLLSSLEKPVIYGVGAVASFWLIERVAAF